MTQKQTTITDFEPVERVLRKLHEMEVETRGDFSYTPQSYTREELVLHMVGDESWQEKARAVLRTHGFERTEKEGVIEEWRMVQ